MSTYAPIGGRLVTRPLLILALLFMLALAILATRFIFGLGSVTNINDGYPWGIWIVIDVMIGTAFGCAGYAVALLVYVFNRGEYHPLMRSALMAGMFGYTLAGIAVIFDLGRYWQFYTLLLPWYMQINSVMLEVALCVMAYVVVLWIEFTPAFLERLGWRDLNRKLSRLLFVFIALGILLPTMHQSSLGSMAVVAGYQISPLWQTQMLPPLFLISALLMGYAIVPFESTLAALGLRQPTETHLLAKISTAAFVVGLVYLVLRFVDLIWRGALGLAFAGNLDALMFWVENLLFIVPVALLARARLRSHPRVIFLSAVGLLLAGSIYRLNVYIIGYHPLAGANWHYFPSLAEIMVTVGVFSFEVILYLLFVKYLPVLHRSSTPPTGATR